MFSVLFVVFTSDVILCDLTVLMLQQFIIEFTNDDLLVHLINIQLSYIAISEKNRSPEHAKNILTSSNFAASVKINL